jgi:hypothetical protein
MVKIAFLERSCPNSLQKYIVIASQNLHKQKVKMFWCLAPRVLVNR